MPGTMDGLKLAAAVRDRWPPIKIVVTSGHRRIEIADIPDGGIFLSKPYRHEAVSASFRELLERGNLSAQANLDYKKVDARHPACPSRRPPHYRFRGAHNTRRAMFRNSKRVC